MRSLASGIELSADLQGEFEGKPFSIAASNRQIVVDIPDLNLFLQILRNRPARSRMRNDLARLNLLLNTLQITLELQIGGTCVARSGFEAHAPLESFFGFKNTKLYPIAIVRAALRRRSKMERS